MGTDRGSQGYYFAWLNPVDSQKQPRNCIVRKIVGATRRLLNFFWPASGAWMPGCGGGWGTQSQPPNDFASPSSRCHTTGHPFLAPTSTVAHGENYT